MVGFCSLCACLSFPLSVCLPFCGKIMQSIDLGTCILSSVGRLLKLDMKDPWQRQGWLAFSWACVSEKGCNQLQ